MGGRLAEAIKWAGPLLLCLTGGLETAAAQEPADAWRAQIELGFNGASGNSSFSILRTGATLTHLRTDVAEFELAGLLRYGRSDGDVIANDMRLSLKFNFRPLADFAPFAFATSSRDRIRKLDLKSNGGAGATFTFWRDGPGKASLSAAALYDYENFRVESGSGDLESRGVARWSFRLEFSRTLGENADLRHITRHDSQFRDLGDYSVEVTNAVSTTILDDLSLVIRHELLHDQVPPPGVKSGDQKFSVTLRVTL